MLLPDFNTLPSKMKNDEVRRYYDMLKKKSADLFFKRIFDLLFSIILLIILSVPMVVIAIAVKSTSSGPVFFRQRRVTAGGKIFRIYKFRTMCVNDDLKNSQVTSGNDSRITSVGRFLRKYRLDELPQLINVFFGDMSFVGTRPEVERYVDAYTPEMYATLLMPAGITSMTSIRYRNEEEILEKADNVEKAYVEEILPQKMKYNLQYIENFHFFYDFYVAILTVVKVIF